ncbi:MAG: YlmC/YmxH family sporulation protein [Firmicutes bacterium]|nr:YlmC/YmxH family sporulation protein [Bacillota bacterium]
MISSRELKNKEIININNGKSMGFVTDIDINLEKARIDALIVPGQKSSFFGMFSSPAETAIKWKDVKIIGEDVILVDHPQPMDPEEIKETDEYIGP